MLKFFQGFLFAVYVMLVLLPVYFNCLTDEDNLQVKINYCNETPDEPATYCSI
jgi:hypothetical protein